MGTVHRFRRLEDVAFRQIGDECLLVPIRRNPAEEMGVFALNRVAAVVWEALASPVTADELATRVAERFEVTPPVARRDIDVLLETLTARHLAERLEA